MTTHQHTNLTTRRIRRLLLPAALGLVVLAGTSCDLDDVGEGSAEHPADEDVNDWACRNDADGDVHALGSVTNHSSGTSDYLITLDYGDEAETTTIVEEVDAGETRVVSTTVDDADERATDCDVVEVERFSS
jgi:hypothetical protein